MTFLRIWGHTPRSNFKSLIAGENHESKGCQADGCPGGGSILPILLRHSEKRTELPKGGIYPILAGGLMRGNLCKSIEVVPNLEADDGLEPPIPFQSIRQVFPR